MIDWPRRRRVVLDLFVLANIAFLALDTYLAHSINRFAHPLEWTPFSFSLLATPLFAVAIAAGWNVERGWCRWLGVSIGGTAIIVGIGGMILHLKSQFFELQTIGSLVYTAPFAAPLAYAGLGLLILMNRMVDPDRTEWGRWIVLLGLGGFVGNFILSLCDHAQNGFFVPSEWIPVVSSSFAVGFLVLAATRPINRPFLGVCALVLLVQAVVGGLGFALHLRGVAGGIGPTLWANLLYGPPIFAPLLFVDLALLSGIGVFDLTRRAP